MALSIQLRRFALLLLVIVGTTAATSQAQYRNSFALGAQLGGPTGLSLVWDRPSSLSYDLTVSWEMDEYVFLNMQV